MPRVPIDYSQTHFYKIVCRNTDIKDCYVGHTTDFTKRKNRHKSDCCNQKSKHHNVPLYQFIRDNGNWDNWQMILIDTLHCENSLDALNKEREYIEELQAKLNNRKPFRTEDDFNQWWNDNKDKIYQRMKEYDKENEGRLKQYRKNRYENNKHEILRKQREYNAKNYEKNRLKQSLKISCECGTTFTKQHKLRHERSTKHQQYLQSLNEN